MRRKDPLTVNNYLKTPSAWIICRAIRAGLSLHSILREQFNMTPASSGFGPLSVPNVLFGLFKKYSVRLVLMGKILNVEFQEGKYSDFSFSTSENIL